MRNRLASSRKTNIGDEWAYLSRPQATGSRKSPVRSSSAESDEVPDMLSEQAKGSAVDEATVRLQALPLRET